MSLQITDDTSMCILITEETDLLRTRDPKHELLKYALSPLSDVLWHEFINRFGGTSGERKDVVAKAYGEYYLVLHKTNEQQAESPKMLVCDDVDSY